MTALRIPGLRLSRSDGEKLLRANDFARAEPLMVEEALAHRRDARPLLLSGHLALMRNDLAAAEARLSEAVTRDRRCREAHELLAEVSYRRDDFDGAANHQDAAGNHPVAAKLRSFSGREPYAIEGPETARLPFAKTDPLPILAAQVNDGAEALFLLDTGGAELILDASFARELGIPLFGTQHGFFGGGKGATLAHGRVESLALGDLTIRNVPVNVMDLRAVGPAIAQPELAGIVGTCLLYRFLATIDYPTEALVLRRKGTAPTPAAGAVDVPLLMANDHFLLAEGDLNDGPRMTHLIDSGLAGGAFACPASTLRAAGIARGSTRRTKGQGGGGAMSAWPFDVASLSVGAARREHLQGIAGVFPPQLEWAYGFRIGGLISHGFLRIYAVTLDFDRMTMRLAPDSH